MRNGFKLALAGLLLAGSVGCVSPCSTTGWTFQVHKPATLTVPAAVSPQNTALAVTPLAAGPGMAVMPPVNAQLAAGYPCGPAQEAGRATLAFGSPPCSVDDLCRRLDRLERTCCQPAPAMAPVPRPLPNAP